MKKVRTEKPTETLCWDCRNCTRCSWADGTPVKGWEATPTVVRDRNGDYNSYLVTKCPQFEEDTKKQVTTEDMARILGKTCGEIIYTLRSRGGRIFLRGWFKEIGYKLRINKVYISGGKEKSEFIIEKLLPQK